MAGNKVKIHVYPADQELRVHPPVAEANADTGGANADKVVIRNHTDEELVVYAGPNIFGATSIAQTIAVNDKIVLDPKSQGANVTKLYAYAIFAPKSGRRAKGNSDPSIIIEN